MLVYALDADSPHHAASGPLLEAAREGSATLYVTSQILCEFYAVVTNARRVANPRTPDDAASAISDFLAFLHVLPVPAHVVDAWLKLLLRRSVIGGDIFDLQLIATMQANNLSRIYTFNIEDFEAFSELMAMTP